jgi:hypothetical protein
MQQDTFVRKCDSGSVDTCMLTNISKAPQRCSCNTLSTTALH